MQQLSVHTPTKLHMNGSLSCVFINHSSAVGKPDSLPVPRFVNVRLLLDYFRLQKDQRYGTDSESRAAEMNEIVRFPCCCCCCCHKKSKLATA